MKTLPLTLMTSLFLLASCGQTGGYDRPYIISDKIHADTEIEPEPNDKR